MKAKMGTRRREMERRKGENRITGKRRREEMKKIGDVGKTRSVDMIRKKKTCIKKCTIHVSIFKNSLYSSGGGGSPHQASHPLASQHALIVLDTKLMFGPMIFPNVT